MKNSTWFVVCLGLALSACASFVAYAALEDMTGSSKYIGDFVNTNPVGATDLKSEGDDHIRGIKNVLLNTFPSLTGAVTATQTQLNLTATATDANTASTIVKRDGSGNFTAGTVTAALSGNATTATTATNIDDQGGGTDLKCKVIEIGDWNMDASATVSPLHGVTGLNIRAINVVIRDDADTTYYNLDNNGSAPGGYMSFTASQVYLGRVTGGSFDSTSFDSTSYNRGWMTIWYF